MSLPGAMHPKGGEPPRANAPICRIIAGPNGAGRTRGAQRAVTRPETALPA